MRPITEFPQVGRFLGEIDAIATRSALTVEIEPFFPKGKDRGLTPIDLERMLLKPIAQQCFELSYEATEVTL